jgi:hypothetical protein
MGLWDERLIAIKIPTIPFFSGLMWHFVTHDYSIAAFKRRWFPWHLKTLRRQCRTLHILWWETWHLNKATRQADSQKGVEFHVLWYRDAGMQLAILILTRLESCSPYQSTQSVYMRSLHLGILNAPSCSEYFWWRH